MTTEAAAKKDTHKLQRAIIDGLEDVKAQDIQVFDTEHLSPLFERVIVASGTSNRQTKALAASVRDAVREAGFPKPRTEGEDNGEWIIVDCGAAVAHIMQPAIRQYYHLEEIWGDKPVRLKLGAAKPAAASAEETAPAKKQPAAAKTLRRASAAKTAIREAEQVAKAEKAERARPAARKTAARKPAAASSAPARKRAATASAAPAAPARKRVAAPGSASTASATTADPATLAAPAKRTTKAAGTAAPAKTPVKVIGKPAARKATSAKGAAAKTTAAPRKAPARKAAPRNP
ncbi:ribosome silencing factor [Variovorax sp. PvP013]|uniref:ribosome silencing factor n=1 Tax=Variovorax sp. PvP013 TaxID=3156435 RepID=UPI003D1D0135